MLCTIDISEASQLDFTLQVFGSTASSIEPRFVIIGKDFAVVCLCKADMNNVSVSVPRLEGILPPGVYKSRFEVIVGPQIFFPIEDEIELVKNIEIAATLQSTSSPQVSVQRVEIKAVPKLKEPVATTEQAPVVNESPVTVDDVKELSPSKSNAAIINAESQKKKFSFLKQLAS